MHPDAFANGVWKLVGAWLEVLPLTAWPPDAAAVAPQVAEVEPKRQELAAANAKLQEANTVLASVQAKVWRCLGR